MTEKPSRTRKYPPMSFHTRIFIAIASAVGDLACRRDGTVNRRLLAILNPFVPADPDPRRRRRVRTADVTVDPSRDLWLRLFIPNTPAAGSSGDKLPLVVFFHGGGFALLSPATLVYDAVCRRLARKLPAVVASVNYRLAPEHKHPAPYVDGIDALRYLENPADPLPDRFNLREIADLASCFLMGDSAGANIAHHVARRFAAEQKPKGLRLAGIVMVQPFVGGEERTEAEVRLRRAPFVTVRRTDWLWRAFLPAGEGRDHPAANVMGPRDDDGPLEEGFPAAMVVVGGWDPLQDWQRRYAERLRGRGTEVRVVEYGDAFHAFYLFPDRKEAALLVEEIREFVRSHRAKG